jgi:hypothetical protein
MRSRTRIQFIEIAANSSEASVPAAAISAISGQLSTPISSSAGLYTNTKGRMTVRSA